MKSITNPTAETIRAVSDCGTHVCLIHAGITRIVPTLVFASACAQGCIPSDPAEDNPATEVDESRVIMIEQIINQILDEGDESLLTLDGCPKASEVKKRFGKHTTEERDQAWENVKDTRDLD